MLESDERTVIRPEAPSRRLEEICELEEMWGREDSRARDGSPAQEESGTPIYARPAAHQLLARYRVGLLFTATWIGFMAVLLAVDCYVAGHTGFWPGFQLAGFTALAVGAAAVTARSVARSRG